MITLILLLSNRVRKCSERAGNRVENHSLLYGAGRYSDGFATPEKLAGFPLRDTSVVCLPNPETSRAHSHFLQLNCLSMIPIKQFTLPN